MLLISTTHRPATDLGYLLHKNPNRVHEAKLPFGMAKLVFPVASEERCAAAVLLEVDSVGLVRNTNQGLWTQYVNDRPYVASSFLSSALLEFFSTAMGGRSKERPELAATAILLEFSLPVVKIRGGEGFLRALFEPLGYTVTAERLPLDEQFEEWGESPYYRVHLAAEITLQAALNHLYVLIPVLDDEKHYWVDKDEIDKLLRRGGEWLAAHPLREEIARRYLRHRRVLTREAIARLAAADDDPDPDAREEEADEKLEVVERKISLHEQRLEAVVEALVASGAKRVLDLGCGEGRLIRHLIRQSGIQEIVGVDASLVALERVKQRLNWERLPEKLQDKLRLVHSSLTYRDRTWEGYDAAALVEVIEHLDEGRLSSLERVVFESARPKTVVVTTPNREYNVLFPTLDGGQFRHPDHRFEWTRAEFEAWCASVSGRFGYTHTISPVGPEDETHGAPSQMAVFSR